jgi:hypothetical protein
MDQYQDGENLMTAKRKRTGLDAAFAPQDVLQAQQPASATVVDMPATTEAIPTTKRKKRAVKALPTYLPLGVYQQLRELRHAEGSAEGGERTFNSYILEGLDRLFTERGLKSVSELETDKE